MIIYNNGIQLRCHLKDIISSNNTVDLTVNFFSVSKEDRCARPNPQSIYILFSKDEAIFSIIIIRCIRWIVECS